MKWITRERPKIDRIACPWLIKNFVDKNAEFIYVPKEDVFKKAKELNAIPYDIPGAEYSHYGDSHLPNTRFVGYNNFTLSSLTGIAKDKPLVIYCSIGKRSENITRKLKKAGYTIFIIYTAAFLNG